jgi:secreted trypsin-like serine protease
MKLNSPSILFVLSATLASLSSQAGSNIVGGTPVVANEAVAKSTVSFIFNAADGGGLCTGTILNSTTILSAAHCVQGYQVGVIAFARDVRDLKKVPQSLLRKVVSVQGNRDFSMDAQGEHNDVALLKFTGGLPAGFQAATVLDPSTSLSYLRMVPRVVVAGFGTVGAERDGSGILRKATMQVRGISPNAKEIYLVHNGETTCHGDSGGPAYIVVKGKYYLWGVLSRGDCSTTAIYTRLTSNFGAPMARP